MDKQSKAICTASSPGNFVLLIAILYLSLFFFTSRKSNKSVISYSRAKLIQMSKSATSSDTEYDVIWFIFLIFH